MALTYLALGSNLGNPIDTVNQAAKAIGALKEVHSMRLSPLYRTEPVGPLYPQPDFINAACEIKTSWPPDELLNQLQAIEESLGKKPKKRGEPRPIDIDILLYGRLAVSEPHLQLPHPRMLERLFVLLPLSHLVDQIPLPSGLHIEIVEQIERLAGTSGRLEQIT